jgi:hypothetical protein
MNKVLKRSMFSMPKHEHKSTGIASGLEYRPGYRVGGRVGFEHGGIHLEDINPDLAMGTGLTVPQSIDIAEQLSAGLYSPDFAKYNIDYTDPALQADYSKYKPSRLGAVGSAAAATIGEPIPEGQSQFANFIANLSGTSAEYAARRQELDQLAEAQAIEADIRSREQDREVGMVGEEFKLNRSQSITDLASKIYTETNKPDTEKFTEAEGFINLLNNPNATAEDIFMEMDAKGINGGFSKTKTDLGERFDDKIWMKRNWDLPSGTTWKSGTNDKIGIPTAADGEAYDLYVREKNKYISGELNKWFGSYDIKGGDIQFTPDMVLKRDMMNKIILQIPENVYEIEGINQAVDAIAMFGPSKNDIARNVALQIIKMTSMLQLEFDDPKREMKDPNTNKNRPITESDLNLQLSALENEYPELYQQILPYVDSARRKFSKQSLAGGGRVGYANGGQVGEISFEEMRTAFTPNQISDYDMKLLTNDRAMLGDFASIRDYSELEDFNTKYATNIELPIG